MLNPNHAEIILGYVQPKLTLSDYDVPRHQYHDSRFGEPTFSGLFYKSKIEIENSQWACMPNTFTDPVPPPSPRVLM